jgi:hypothetical protein
LGKMEGQPYSYLTISELWDREGKCHRYAEMGLMCQQVSDVQSNKGRHGTWLIWWLTEAFFPVLLSEVFIIPAPPASSKMCSLILQTQ